MKKNFIQMSLSFATLLLFCLTMSLQAQARISTFANPGNSLNMADYSLLGENPMDFSGYSVASAGDVDGDGLADLIIGAPESDEAGVSAGKAYIILGSTLLTGITSLADADYMFTGEVAEDHAGRVVSSAGDVDGDGLSDILISADGNDEAGRFAGKVYLVLASSLTPGVSSLSSADFSFTGQASELAAESVASAGDVDGDGLGDILISGSSYSYRNTRNVYLILGKSLVRGTTSLLSADYIFNGEAVVNSISGLYATGAGDVDGDGLSDVLVGIPANDEAGILAGKAYLLLAKNLVLGTSSLSGADYSFTGENADDWAGAAIASAGDVDGDGLSDILVGAHRNTTAGSYAGKAYLFLASSLVTGTVSLSTADYMFTGEAVNNFAGKSVSGLGDIDGDGKSDILIGASCNNGTGTCAGKVYAILSSSLTTGTTSLANADYMFIGEGAYGYAGTSAVNAGDVNGDGTNDILIGAYGYPGFYPIPNYMQGKSYVILSNEICAVHADAGPDQVVDEGVTVTLDGSGSFTSCSSGSLTYSWEATYYSSPVTLSDTTAIYPTFTSGVDGDIYVFTLTVEGDGHSDSDTIVVTVHSNTAPVANNVSLITTSSRASLGPDATDADGDIFTNYYYHLDRKPTRSRASISPTGYSTIPATVINMDLNGTYVISYKVYDGREWSNTATITIVKRPDFDY